MNAKAAIATVAIAGGDCVIVVSGGVTSDGPSGGASGDAGDPLQARVVEHLRATPRPQPAQQLRDTLHVRKADLLEALRCLADRGLVSKTEHGWTLATAAAAP